MELQNHSINGCGNKLFENLPDLIPPQTAAEFLNRKLKTIYDWQYRGKTRKNKIPSELFTKISGGLFIRKDILRIWIYSRNSPFKKGE